MTFPEAKLRHTTLCAEIRMHNHQYYVLAQPLVSDAAYDARYHELLDLEARFPELLTPDSPSCRPQSKTTKSCTETSKQTCLETPFKMPDVSVDPHDMTDSELTAHLDKLRSIQKKDLHQLLTDEALGRQEHKGFIYILSNRAMPGLLKIGSTSGPVEKRVRHLNSATGVPEPFRVEARIPVYESLRRAEQKAHAALNLYRQTSNREFFRIELKEAQLVVEAALGAKAERLQHDWPRQPTHTSLPPQFPQGN